MAKVCACLLCRQCLFIDGFGEFGESIIIILSLKKSVTYLFSISHEITTVFTICEDKVYMAYLVISC